MAQLEANASLIGLVHIQAHPTKHNHSASAIRNNRTAPTSTLVVVKPANPQQASTHIPEIGNLDGCASEPIHIPGAIQPHGMLLSVDEPGLKILQVSANAAEFLGSSAAELVGKSVPELLSAPEVEALREAVAHPDPSKVSPLLLTFNQRPFDVLLHRHRGALIVELEPAPPAAETFAKHHRQLQDYLKQMQEAADPAVLFEAIGRAVSALTGYERVMVYKFDEDWHGEVVAETLTAEVDSYLGHHFPASDIPAQARALYSKSWLRIIPNVTYQPAGLQPPLDPRTGKPLDLSFAALRSVSPIHLEYLRNMGVGASMSISLIVNDRLWGLIACHHGTARVLPFAVRTACELLGQIASREIASQQERRHLAERAEVNRIQTRFFDVIAKEENVAEALLHYTPTLLEFMSAHGAAIALGSQCNLVGQTPSRSQVASLLKWLGQLDSSEPVFVTDHLSAHLPEAAAYKEVASGVLAVRLSRVEPHFVVWFRPEVLTTVTWAGDPNKAFDPAARIHPRKSFAAWQETVAGHSLPWKEAEVHGAHELRLALNALVIRRTERLLRLNTELERKNSDLNSFAYIASHDLKEPLRGIHHFSRFLREDHAEELGTEGMRKVDTIAALAAHTNELLVSLAHFSQLGRMELNVRETDLERLLTEVLLTLNVPLNEKNAEVRRPTPLPIVRCDPVLVKEIFTNLILNAIKYNNNEAKWVEITARDTTPEEADRGPVVCVSDNGIGIRDRNLTTVFQMFRRLNKDKFGSGSGAGLAIAKSIVERHGGRIWAESVFGEGSTFCFTLH